MAVCGHMFCNWDWRIMYNKKGERMKLTYRERQERAEESPGGKSIMLTAPKFKL